MGLLKRLYFKRLVVEELEGELLKATKARDAAKMRSSVERLAPARRALYQAEVDLLEGV